MLLQADLRASSTTRDIATAIQNSDLFRAAQAAESVEQSQPLVILVSNVGVVDNLSVVEPASAKAALPIALVAGAAGGGLLIIILVIVACYLCCCRKRGASDAAKVIQVAPQSEVSFGYYGAPQAGYGAPPGSYGGAPPTDYGYGYGGASNAYARGGPPSAVPPPLQSFISNNPMRK